MDRNQITLYLEKYAQAPNFITTLIAVLKKTLFRKENEFRSQWDYLNKNELAFLIGLYLKHRNSVSEKWINNVKKTVSEIENLLMEYHKIFLPKTPSLNPNMLQESIIYGSEGYDYDYASFFLEKYALDDDWILKNKGFRIKDVWDFFLFLKNIINLKLNKNPKNDVFFYHKNSYLFKKNPQFQKIIEAFLIKETETVNENFNQIGDENEFRKRPIIERKDMYFIPDIYCFAEAMYYAPFFWMMQDKTYSEKAKENRGICAEEIVFQQLLKIFSKEQVFKNIQVVKNKNRISDLDVSVLYDDILIVFSVKSKMLTQDSKAGNISQIEKDFLQAIKESYEKPAKSYQYIIENTCTLCDDKNNEILDTKKIKKIYTFCILLEHYPSATAHAEIIFKDPPFWSPENKNKKIDYIVLSIFDFKIFVEYLKGDDFIKYIQWRHNNPNIIAGNGIELSHLQFYLENKENLLTVLQTGYDGIAPYGTEEFDDNYYPKLVEKYYRDFISDILPQYINGIDLENLCFCGSGDQFNVCCKHFVK